MRNKLNFESIFFLVFIFWVPLTKIIREHDYYYTHLYNKGLFAFTFFALSIIGYFLVKRYIDNKYLKVLLITYCLALVVQSFFGFYTRTLELFFIIYGSLLLVVYFTRNKLFEFVSMMAPYFSFALVILMFFNLAGGVYSEEHKKKEILEYSEFSKQYENQLTTTSNRPKRKNVYHFIFDHITGQRYRDYFSEHKSALMGATFYPRAITSYGNTAYSLSSLIRGRTMLNGETDTDFLASEKWRKFSTTKFDDRNLGYTELFRKIMDLGYYTTLTDIFVHTESDYRFESQIFGAKKIGIGERLLQQFVMFYSQYLWAIFPQSINDLGIYRSVNPIYTINDARSVANFLDFIESDKFPVNNNYFLFYNRYPHPPYVLNEDCSYDYPNFFTSYHEQTQCFIRTVEKIIKTLDTKHGKGEYVLIIHSDHGEDISEKHNPFLITNLPTKSGKEVDEAIVSIMDLIPAVIKSQENPETFDYKKDFEVLDLKMKPFFYKNHSGKQDKYIIDGKTFSVNQKNGNNR